MHCADDYPGRFDFQVGKGGSDGLHSLGYCSCGLRRGMKGST